MPSVFAECTHPIIWIDQLVVSVKGSVTVRGVGMFMRFFEKSYKV